MFRVSSTCGDVPPAEAVGSAQNRHVELKRNSEEQGGQRVHNVEHRRNCTPIEAVGRVQKHPNHNYIKIVRGTGDKGATASSSTLIMRQ